mmetsp:Transcript_44873/g.130719  ORF Transcript_44873/g.130719 Transcript_44873/m.130719 type:complete len:242 (+) Transcript_44873:2761-3486(+)
MPATLRGGLWPALDVGASISASVVVEANGIRLGAFQHGTVSASHPPANIFDIHTFLFGQKHERLVELLQADAPLTLGDHFGEDDVDVRHCQGFVDQAAILAQLREALAIHVLSSAAKCLECPLHGTPSSEARAAIRVLHFLHNGVDIVRLGAGHVDFNLGFTRSGASRPRAPTTWACPPTCSSHGGHRQSTAVSDGAFDGTTNRGTCSPMQVMLASDTAARPSWSRSRSLAANAEANGQHA